MSQWDMAEVAFPHAGDSVTISRRRKLRRHTASLYTDGMSTVRSRHSHFAQNHSTGQTRTLQWTERKGRSFPFRRRHTHAQLHIARIRPFWQTHESAFRRRHRHCRIQQKRRVADLAENALCSVWSVQFSLAPRWAHTFICYSLSRDAHMHPPQQS